MKNDSHPKAIFIQLLTFCNANCINCPFEFTYRAIHPKGTMNDKTWNKILSDIISMDYRGQVGFYLHHEPLLDKSLFSKIKDINEKTNAHAVLSTNGALLSQEKIEKLIKASPKRVHININSGNKKEYERSMALDYELTIANAKSFIKQAKGKMDLEINCPIMEGFDIKSLETIFPDVQVNSEYWANSRGGLLPDLYHEEKGSRFKVDNYCRQPSQNFNILYDGSTIACCMDWMQESINDSPNIHNSSILSIYTQIKKMELSFKNGDYSKYKMCQICSKEMGFRQNDNGSKLSILLANHHLSGTTGSEVLTLTLAKELNKQGHFVTIYSKFINPSNLTDMQDSIRFVANLEEILEEKFDISHVHHNISAIEVRNSFKDLPIVFLSQGVLPFLEQPFSVDVGISKFFALSEEVENNLKSYNINSNKIEIIRNLIEIEKFTNNSVPSKNPERALVLSRNIDSEKEKIIREACSLLNINVEFLGGRFGEVSQNIVKNKIENVDIVFSLGRGALESMIGNKAVVIYDYLGGDGMVLPETYHEIRKNNFSGRRYGFQYSVSELVDEIKKYDVQKIETVSKLIKENYSSSQITGQLVEIYKNIISANQPISISESSLKLLNETSNIIKETITANSGNIFNSIILSERQNNLDELLHIGEELIQQNNTSGAKVVLEKALVKSPNNLDLLNDLAVIEIMEENYNNALGYISKILSIDPNNEIANGNIEYLESLTNSDNK